MHTESEMFVFRCLHTVGECESLTQNASTRSNADVPCFPTTFSLADKAFTAMQFIATIIISVCMVVLMVALFRPKVAGCCSSKALLLAGGLMMAVFALFQLLAIILAVGVEKKLDAFGALSVSQSNSIRGDI